MKGGHHFGALILELLKFSYSIFNDMHQHFSGDALRDRLKSKTSDDLTSAQRIYKFIMIKYFFLSLSLSTLFTSVTVTNSHRQKTQVTSTG